MRKIPARRALLGLWLLGWPLLAFALWFPISFGALRLFIAILCLCLWGGALGLFWPRRPVRVVVAALGLGVAFVTFWPHQRDEGPILQKSYRHELALYLDTPYVWGGENRRGIDCSGLVRRALIDANLKQGFFTRNPALWREAFAIWWRDCSAREMKNGYGGRIQTLFAAPSLNDLNYGALKSGDLAVMQSGVHVLAYLKEGTWIQADPNAVSGDKVILTHAPSKNGWFSQPVVICRWRQLENGG